MINYGFIHNSKFKTKLSHINDYKIQLICSSYNLTLQVFRDSLNITTFWTTIWCIDSVLTCCIVVPVLKNYSPAILKFLTRIPLRSWMIVTQKPIMFYFLTSLNYLVPPPSRKQHNILITLESYPSNLSSSSCRPK